MQLNENKKPRRIVSVIIVTVIIVLFIGALIDLGEMIEPPRDMAPGDETEWSAKTT